MREPLHVHEHVEDGALHFGLVRADRIAPRQGKSRGSPGWHCWFHNGAHYCLVYGNWKRVWGPINDNATTPEDGV